MSGEWTTVRGGKGKKSRPEEGEGGDGGNLRKSGQQVPHRGQGPAKGSGLKSKDVPERPGSMKSGGVRDARNGNTGAGEVPKKLDLKPRIDEARGVSDTRTSFNKQKKPESDSLPASVKPSPGSSQVNKPSTSRPSSGVPIGEAKSDIAKKKKKKPTASKEERQRIREAKYLQALYKNKDSHIQFVSADVIRQCQGLTPLSSRSSKKDLFAAPSTSKAETALPPGTTDFFNFPVLTPAQSSSQKNKLGWVHRESTESQETSAEKSQVVETRNNEQSNAEPTTSTVKGKKSKQPLVIDVSDLIVQNKKDKDNDRKGPVGGIPLKTVVTRKENHKLTMGNQLDSSGPGVIHRGKIRDKKKKPTKLKLSILKSRELRRILREGASAHEDSEETFVPEIFSCERDITTELERLRIQDAVAESDDAFPSEKCNAEPDLSIGEIAESQPELVNESVASDIEEAHKKVDEEETSLILSPLADVDSRFMQLLEEITSLKSTDSVIPVHVEKTVKTALHNRKFRDYCDMFTSKELNGLVTRLLYDLYKFQDRLYHSDPIKFKTKRRMVVGLKDALSYVNLDKVQLLIIAPDIESNPEPGGLDDRVHQLITSARDSSVPYVFASNKYILGKPLRIKTPTSVIAVLDKQNCEETFQQLLEVALKLREKYHDEFLEKTKDLMSCTSSEI